MTISLREDITTGQGLVSVHNAEEAHLDEVLQIGDEYVIVRNRPSPGGKLMLGRGALGSARATHAADATFAPFSLAPGGSISATDGTTTVNPATSIQFPAGTLSDLGSGVAGVGLVLQQIGPFRINFDDVGIAVPPGMVVATIPAGSLVLKVWAAVLVNWNSSTYDILDLQLPDGTVVSQYDLQASAIALAGTYIEGLPPTPASVAATVYMLPVIALIRDTDTTLNAYVISDGPLTAGEADVYVVIATPAS